jgi:phage gp46-like protein
MAHLWDTVWNIDGSQGTWGDWNLSDPSVETSNIGGLQNQDDLSTAILIALFTDAKIPDYMVNQYGFTTNDQFEWHGNTFNIEENEEPLGSMLWTLQRSPLTEYTAKLAEHYAALALQPLVRQKLVSSFYIHSEIDKIQGKLSLIIETEGLNARRWVADLFPLR